jgi:hypothetical protein
VAVRGDHDGVGAELPQLIGHGHRRLVASDLSAGLEAVRLRPREGCPQACFGIEGGGVGVRHGELEGGNELRCQHVELRVRVAELRDRVG